MASTTPFIEALKHVLDTSETDANVYVSQVDSSGITIDGWWESGPLEVALAEVFTLKGA